MAKKKKEEAHHSCDGGKKYFYLLSSFMLIFLVVIVTLFFVMRNGSFGVTGQAGSLPSINPDTDFAKFKQCLCGAAKEETKPMSVIPVVPQVVFIPKAEICNNQKDDNDNKEVDCAEASCDAKDCGSTAAVSAVCSKKLCVKKELACHDGIDNDLDGKKDCDDLDCWEIDMTTGSKDYGKNKCWQFPDKGAKKVGSVYLGLAGHSCKENEDCEDGYCNFKNSNVPSVGKVCSPYCVASCAEVYPGLQMNCVPVTTVGTDTTYICKSPYGVY